MKPAFGAVVAASILLGACTSDTTDIPDASEPAQPAPEEAELIRSGVGIVAEGCSLVAQLGSGVVLDRPGQVVTVAHTIAGAKTITVVDAAGAEHDATVRAFDKDADLALLDVPDLAAPALLLGTVELGAGRTLEWSRDNGVEAQDVDVVKRIAITIEDIYNDGIVQRSGLEISGDILIGDSGGPVLTAQGDVIGIIYASSRQRSATGFATDSDQIEELLAMESDDAVANGRCK